MIDPARLSADSKLECKICWWVYDPATGDPEAEIPAQTAFSALPTHWRCPRCDSSSDHFLVLP